MKVHHREKVIGVDSRLIAFLDWWETHGPFELTICEDGGVRTDEERQLHYFATGRSKARTLEETPHGRAGAFDAAPLVDGAVDWKNLAPFQVMGRLAEAHGLHWGGHFPRPDLDHIQVPDWRKLPFPPVLPANT